MSASVEDKDAIIASLREENESLRVHQSARDTAFDERAAHQAATIDVLKAMSASPGDARPALETIVRRAWALCGEQSAIIYRIDGPTIHLVAYHRPGLTAEQHQEVQSLWPRPVTSAPMAPAVTERRILHVRDIDAWSGGNETARRFWKSAIWVPMLRGDTVIGLIGIDSLEKGGFSDTQVELLETFAEQAVIAITSAETYRSLQTRTAELATRNTEYSERIDHQSATIDVLQAMSSSPGDPRPVFDLIAIRARDICGAYGVTVFEFDGSLIHRHAETGVSEDAAEREAAKAAYPMAPTRERLAGRAILERGVVHIRDHRTEPDLLWLSHYDTAKSSVTVPMMRGGVPIGALSMGSRETGGFSDTQTELLKTFAEQAVIAINSAETFRALRARTAELAERTRDLEESLDYQTATGDMLKVVSRSTFDLQPVLDTVCAAALRLCEADQVSVFRFEDGMLRFAASLGYPPDYAAAQTAAGLFPLRRNTPSVGHRCVAECAVVHYHDVAVIPGYPEVAIREGRQRTSLGVPLVRDGDPIGVILLARQRVEPFTEQQIALVSTFADQAVIAIENTRLVTEQREALERQTATAEVLQVINASPGDLTPVFDVVLEKALKICQPAFGALRASDGERWIVLAERGTNAALAAYRAANPDERPSANLRRMLETRRPVHLPDIREGEGYRAGHPGPRAVADLGGARTLLLVPLLKEDAVVGSLQIYRQEVRAFTTNEISLLENFAAQAVIAIDNARLLNEIRRRQSELDITFENMGDGVAMFDHERKLAAWNRNFQDILGLPDDAVRVGLPFADYVRGLAERGEYGVDANADEQIARLTALLDQANRFERTRPNGRVIDVRQNPIPGGGFVIIYADITERKRAEEILRAAHDEAETALRELKLAQANLVQAEKMASLGQLTAGIAHEIKNPLNFVNNFASLSVDLLAELQEAAEPGFAALTEHQRAEIDDISNMLTGNLQKIAEHGKRADGIVKAMLEHSRGESGERREVDINALSDEALNLAYHGARAQDQTFNITLERGFGEGIAPIELNPQDITRVFLNLFSNGFYAATRRARNGAAPGFSPMLKISTRDTGGAVEIRVRDNGTGIPDDIRDKLFQPFFTTKPTGEGTGLGLSITYDIVTKQHGGAIAVESEVDAFTEFVVTLPRGMSAPAEGAP
jgi:two-component system, NtrC family, sensor kinase